MLKKMVIMLLGLIFTCHAMEISEKERICRLLSQTNNLEQLRKEIHFLLSLQTISQTFVECAEVQQIVEEKMLQEITPEKLCDNDYKICTAFRQMGSKSESFKKRLYEKLLRQYSYKKYLHLLISSNHLSKLQDPQEQLQQIEYVLYQKNWLYQPFPLTKEKKRTIYGKRQDPIQVH